MSRSLVPRTKTDRLWAITMIAGAIVGIFEFATNQPTSQIVITSLFVILSALFAYVFQDQPPKEQGSAEYTKIIARLAKTTDDLTYLQAFLERERIRVTEAEATLSGLRAEKEKLEPLVKTDRQIIEAVLEAHTQRSKRTVWNERLVGFTLGVFASLLASAVYEGITKAAKLVFFS